MIGHWAMMIFTTAVTIMGIVGSFAHAREARKTSRPRLGLMESEHVPPRGPHSPESVRRLDAEARHALAVVVRSRATLVELETFAWPENGFLPTRFAFLVTTRHDEQKLRASQALDTELRAVLSELGYRSEDLAGVEFDFISEDRFEREFQRDWYYYWR